VEEILVKEKGRKCLDMEKKTKNKRGERVKRPVKKDRRKERKEPDKPRSKNIRGGQDLKLGS